MSRRYRAALFALPVVLALASCGGSSSSHTSTGPSAGAPAAPSRPPAGSAVRATDWPTYHRDLARTGYDARAPRAARLRRAWSASLDGDAYAEPLVAGGRVIVATENDSL